MNQLKGTAWLLCPKTQLSKLVRFPEKTVGFEFGTSPATSDGSQYNGYYLQDSPSGVIRGTAMTWGLNDQQRFTIGG